MSARPPYDWPRAEHTFWWSQTSNYARPSDKFASQLQRGSRSAKNVVWHFLCWTVRPTSLRRRFLFCWRLTSRHARSNSWAPRLSVGRSCVIEREFKGVLGACTARDPERFAATERRSLVHALLTSMRLSIIGVVFVCLFAPARAVAQVTYRVPRPAGSNQYIHVMRENYCARIRPFYGSASSTRFPRTGVPEILCERLHRAEASVAANMTST